MFLFNPAPAAAQEKTFRVVPWDYDREEGTTVELQVELGEALTSSDSALDFNLRAVYRNTRSNAPAANHGDFVIPATGGRLSRPQRGTTTTAGKIANIRIPKDRVFEGDEGFSIEVTILNPGWTATSANSAAEGGRISEHRDKTARANVLIQNVSATSIAADPACGATELSPGKELTVTATIPILQSGGSVYPVYRYKVDGGEYGDWRGLGRGSGGTLEFPFGTIGGFGATYTLTMQAGFRTTDTGEIEEMSDECTWTLASPFPPGTAWAATLTVGQPSTIRFGCQLGDSSGDCYENLSNRSYALGGEIIVIEDLYLQTTDNALTFGHESIISDALKASLAGYALRVDDVTLPFTNANYAGFSIVFSNTGLSWSVGDKVSLSIVESNVTVPGAPTGLTVIPGNQKLTASWSPPSSNGGAAISGYKLQHKEDSATDWPTATDVPSATAEITGLTNGTSYDVRVRAVNSRGSGDWSAVAMGTPMETPLPEVSLSASPNPVPEGSSVTVTATLSEALASPVTIPVTITNNTAESGDYSTLSSISITADATSGTDTITATQDTDTDNETFTVALDLDTLPSSVTPGTPSSVQITITDDDTDDDTTRTPTTDDPTDTPTNTGGPGTGGGGGGPAPPGGTPSPSPRCGKSDEEYLVSLYEDTGGEDYWREYENWDSQEPLDEWFGVETDEDGEVISLRLANNGLSGDMPTEELLCLNKNTELKELALWGNENLSGDVPKGLELAVERAALRAIAEMFSINPEWFENYEDPFDFEDWHTGVTTDDEGRVTGLDLTAEGVIGEIPEILSEQLQKLRETMITTSSGGCAVGASSAHAGVSGLLAAVFIMLLAVSRGFRVRSY